MLVMQISYAVLQTFLQWDPATQQERQEIAFTILKKNYNQMNNDKLHSLTDSQVSRCFPPRSTQFVYIRLKEKGILVVHGGTP